MDEPIIQDDIIEAKVSKEIIDNLSTDIASKYDEKLSEVEERESSKYVWLSFVVILFSLVATYSVVGNYIKERFVSYLEFNTRSKLGQDVKIAKNLKILVKDDNLIAHMGKPNLSMDEWVEILQSVAAHKPKAIYIDKIFSITGFKESDTSKKEKFNEAIEKIMDIGGPTAAAAQGALATVDDNNKEMHKVKPIDPKEKEQLELDLKGGGDKKESLSMEERFEMFLMEKDPAQGELPLDNPNSMGAKAKRGIGSALGKVGGAIKKGAGAVAGAAKSAGKELGNKVTYNKLMKSWKDAGSPTDSASVMNILQDAGLSNDQITTIGKENKVDLKPKTQPKADATGTATPQTGGTPAQGGDATAQAGSPQADAPAQSQPAGNAEVKPSAIKKGQTMKANDGNEYKWMGALWVNTATNKPIGIMPSMKAGLPNPKLDPIIAAAKKDPKLAKLIKQQIASKGVEAGSAGAQKAAQAGVKGTEKLDAKGVTK